MLLNWLKREEGDMVRHESTAEIRVALLLVI